MWFRGVERAPAYGVYELPGGLALRLGLGGRMDIKLEARIGQPSGQGEVWRARTGSGQEVAVKLVTLPSGPERKAARKRFEREARCQQELQHPGIAQILTLDLEADRPYYVMPLAKGSLHDLMRMYPAGMPEEIAVPLFMKILDAVAFAHAHRPSVLHRDLKPANVLIYGEEPVIADFGLGLRLQSGSTTITTAHGVGTFGYAAPEQLLDGHHVDERADIYSLGALFYEMLTATSPWPRMDYQRVPASFRHMVFVATQPRPEQRYVTVEALIIELHSVLHDAEDLQRPVDRANEYLTSVEANGSASDAKILMRILLENDDDAELYAEFVRHASSDLMMMLAETSPELFEQVVGGLDRYADGQFIWEFSDEVGNALITAFQATDRLDLRTVIIRRLMLLAQTHRRWPLRRRIVTLILSNTVDRSCVRVVAQLLKDDDAVREFFTEGFRGQSLPRLIADALATSGV